MKTALLLFVVLALSHQVSRAQKIEDGWKGLLPYVSTQADVEKLYGKGKKVSDSQWYQYEYIADGVVLKVDYLTHCDPTEKAPFRLDLPTGTIIRYRVELKPGIPLDKFTFDLKRFERSDWTDRSVRKFGYVQWEKDLSMVPNEWTGGWGIEFWGDSVDNRDVVNVFEYLRPYAGRGKYLCEEPSY